MPITHGRPLRLVHIGVGGRGLWPLQLLAQAREAGGRQQYESVALVDISEDALAVAREITGLGQEKCFTSLATALAGGRENADAAVIITSPGIHTAQCLEVLSAGLHLMVEKPFTKDLKEAVSVVEEAAAHGLEVMVCQNDRWRSGADTLQAVVRSGRLGALYFGLMTRFGHRPNVRHSGEDDHAYLWERGIHDFDTILHIFDSTPARLFCDSWNPPWSPYRGGAGVSAWIQFESGARCTFLLTFMDPPTTAGA
eukprot:SAG11_NODE_8676_length_988_cov_1.490439_1_plen_253_part_01